MFNINRGLTREGEIVGGYYNRPEPRYSYNRRRSTSRGRQGRPQYYSNEMEVNELSQKLDDHLSIFNTKVKGPNRAIQPVSGKFSGRQYQDGSMGGKWKASIECWNCKETGHFARDCPRKSQRQSRSRERQSSSMRRQNSRQRDSRSRSRSRVRQYPQTSKGVCYICKGQGHMRANCPSTRAFNANKYGYKYTKCDQCGGIGHLRGDHQ